MYNMDMGKKSVIKQTLSEAPPKVLRDDTPLSHYPFDLLWDAKTGKDLKLLGLTRNPSVHRALAEAGFDVKAWKKEIEEWRIAQESV